jgi:hypothetical protein
MTERAQLLAEAYRRGLLKGEERQAYEEAMNRGLITQPTQVVQPEQRSMLEELQRQAGLTLRHGVEGAMALPAMAADVVGRGLSMIPGVDIPSTTETISRGLTQMGVPQPETQMERMVAAPSRALAGAGTTMGMGGAIAGSPGAVGGIGQTLAAAPGAQATAAMAAGGAGQLARESEVGPVGQTLAEVGAGMLAPSAVSAVGQVAASPFRAAAAMAQPLYKGGRERLVGGALRRLADKPEQAISRMQQAEEIIPGVKPTIGTVSKDYGLAAAERTMRSMEPARFAERTAEQAKFRISYLDRIANADLVKATSRRDNALHLLDRAMASNPRVNVRPVIDKIDDILAGPAGKRKAVKSALTDIKQSMFDPDGNLETTLDNVYGIRQNIGDKFDPKAMQDPQTSNYRIAKKQIMEVKDALDKELGKVSDDFMVYLRDYARQSKPINQIEAARLLKERVVAPGTGLEGEEFITAGRWHSHFTRKKSELKQVLTPRQMWNLDKITKDLDRGNKLASIRPLGSDTVQNLSVANIIGRTLNTQNQPSNPLLRTLTRPLDFLYRIPDQAANEMLTEAMLDPKWAAELMKKATPTRTESIANILRKKLEASAYGTAIGIGAAQ